jgi:CheY-like chemotaxis protein
MFVFLARTAVLVVDDSVDNGDMLAELLTDRGASVRTARDGDEALDILSGWRPDVLLVDVDLGHPLMTGYDLLLAIRQEPSRANIPAIAVTAFARDMDKKRTSDAGFEAHVCKPFDFDVLADLIAELVVASKRLAG